MEIVSDNKVLTREGVFELIDDKYIQFVIHEHITTHRVECLHENFDAVRHISKGKKYDMLTFTETMNKLGTEEEEIIRDFFQNYLNHNRLLLIISFL